LKTPSSERVVELLTVEPELNLFSASV